VCCVDRHTRASIVFVYSTRPPAASRGFRPPKHSRPNGKRRVHQDSFLLWTTVVAPSFSQETRTKLLPLHPPEDRGSARACFTPTTGGASGPRGLGVSQRFCSVSSASVFSRIGTISTTTKTTIDAIRVRSSGWMTCIAAGTCFFDRRPQPAKQYVHETSPACPSYLKPLVASGPFAPPHPPDVPMTG